MECADTTQPGWLFGIYDNAAVRTNVVAGAQISFFTRDEEVSLAAHRSVD